MRRSRGAAACALVAAAAMTGACGSQTDAAGSTSAAPAGSSSTTTSGTTQGSLHCTAAPGARSTVPTLKLPDKRSAVGRTFTASIRTNCGTITATLLGGKAPQTVASFIALARSFYTDTPCHRLTTAGIYVLQCGDPTGTGQGGPGYGYGIENAPATGSYPAGTLAMARTQDPNSNGSQFFMVYRDSAIDPSTGGYSIFGRITSGLSILQALATKGVDGAGDGPPLQPIGILKITVTEQKA